MTENETEIEPDQTENETEPDPDQTETETEANPSREAAKYRKQLRLAEAARDRLAEQVDQLRRREVEQAASLQQPGGLWRAGAEVAQFYDDDGQLDGHAVNQFVKDVGLATRATPDPGQGSGHRSAPTPGRDFSDAFKPR